MKGYRAMSRTANGPVRSVFADSRNGVNSAHLFSPWGVQRLQFDDTGAGSALEDRTPTTFTKDDALTWSVDEHVLERRVDVFGDHRRATPDLNDLTSNTDGSIYYGDITSNAPLVAGH
jgi:hypothetical protein